MKLHLHAVLAVLIAALSFGVYHYHDAYSETSSTLKLANATISDMQTRQRDVAALDAKYTKELADAKKIISDLHRDVAAGRKRLLISATCSNNPTTPGVANAGTARITPYAERDYFRLRAGIETITKQLTGLQQYVREQCLK
ncbi:lysis protein [Symbiopectobacterium purcellii]|uniref:Lysis protein n=1 Tax=Symbiopectobacterium purcellii TaxID=2871826 RepID=A0ABX9ATL2_9ENTR|nr:lysis protein [Symbiopectobacterium purcellii]QZN97341.1 lysis protein [Symbiopectobacterium purcellii]